MANKKVTPLTDTEIKKAKARDKNYTLSDGDGLQLLIKTDGKKIWEIRYTINGKAKKTTAGTYPETPLATKTEIDKDGKDIITIGARQKRDELRAKVLRGIDPIEEKREQKTIIEEMKKEDEARLSGQFHLVTYGWLENLTNDEATTVKRKRAFERDIFPHLCTYDEKKNIISSKHIEEITHAELLKIIKIKEQTAAETARRLLTDCNRLWLYAISHGHASFNITANISKKDALKKPVNKNYAKITDENTLGELLRVIDAYNGSIIVKNVLRFVAIIPLRADNLCKLKWSYIDFDKKIATIPRSEMKVKDKNIPDFLIPLPDQAINILKEIKEITGWGQWVFHGVSQPLTHVNKESGNKALRLMGFNDEEKGRKQTLHSFRGTFRSLAETHQSKHGATFEVKERVLDHQEEKVQVRAYTHMAIYTEQMRTLLQWWADYLDELKTVKA